MNATAYRPLELRNRVALWIASGGYTGYARIAPGTVGSFVGLLLYLPIAGSQVVAQLAVIGIVLGLGVWASDQAEKVLKIVDPRPVVIDEIVGMWISVLFVPHKISYFLSAFLLFRLFDVVKPFPAKQAEHLRGGWGIMADDVIAALYTNAVLQAVQICQRLFSVP